MAKRGNFTEQFKAKVALEALRGDLRRQEARSLHRVQIRRPAGRTEG